MSVGQSRRFFVAKKFGKVPVIMICFIWKMSFAAKRMILFIYAAIPFCMIFTCNPRNFESLVAVPKTFRSTLYDPCPRPHLWSYCGNDIAPNFRSRPPNIT